MCHNSKLIVFDILILEKLIKPNFTFTSFPKFNNVKCYIDDEILDSKIICLPFDKKLCIHVPSIVKDYQIYLNNIIAKCVKCNFYTNFNDKKCACPESFFYSIELASITKLVFTSKEIYTSNIIIKNIFDSY